MVQQPLKNNYMQIGRWQVLKVFCQTFRIKGLNRYSGATAFRHSKLSNIMHISNFSSSAAAWCQLHFSVWLLHLFWPQVWVSGFEPQLHPSPSITKGSACLRTFSSSLESALVVIYWSRTEPLQENKEQDQNMSTQSCWMSENRRRAFKQRQLLPLAGAMTALGCCLTETCLTGCAWAEAKLCFIQTACSSWQ